uniref:NAC-A/B domain-containing protein n=1 Tax=Daucus carota subsp. sativus TaxID=79200 RepID=A0A162AD84_DAUCS
MKIQLLWTGQGDASGRSKQSRSEKKSRKAMLKLGMKAIPGVSRVTVKKSKNAAEQFKAPNLSNVIPKAEPSVIAQDDEDVDETGVEPKDIELVMTQAGVSRSKAVKALKAADGDIVSAIMELTN